MSELKKNSIIDNNFILIILIVYSIIITYFSYRMWVLYEPQATIVLHDYGQVFESEIDWKLWRIEHERG